MRQRSRMAERPTCPASRTRSEASTSKPTPSSVTVTSTPRSRASIVTAMWLAAACFRTLVSASAPLLTDALEAVEALGQFLLGSLQRGFVDHDSLPELRAARLVAHQDARVLHRQQPPVLGEQPVLHVERLSGLRGSLILCQHSLP